jgi:hypothetical protein
MHVWLRRDVQLAITTTSRQAITCCAKFASFRVIVDNMTVHMRGHCLTQAPKGPQVSCEFR